MQPKERRYMTTIYVSTESLVRKLRTVVGAFLFVFAAEVV